jgi:nucleotide-binding universal stress UspA family protein
MSKIFVAVPLDQPLQKTLVNKMKAMDLNSFDSIHLIHVFKQESYPYMLPPTIYPPADQKHAISESIVEMMKSMWSDVKRDEVKDVYFECTFAESPRRQFVEILKAGEATKVLVATRGKHGIEGIFSSSFTEHLVKYSPCDLLVVRSKD